MLKNALTNWKTTLAGVIVIGLGGLKMAGVAVPGYTDPGIVVDLTVGLGLIVAQDGTKALSDVISSITGQSAAK